MPGRSQAGDRSSEEYYLLSLFLVIDRILNSLLDPRFFFRPDIFFKAVLRKLRPKSGRVVATTSWGDAFDLDPLKLIGSHVFIRGVHELTVCEALARLADRDETLVDVGANIGIMTSLMSRVAGPDGKVIACEAHPVIVEELKKNVARWKRGNILVMHTAISDACGTLRIMDAADAHLNEGTSKVLTRQETITSGKLFTVPATTLDELVGAGRLGVMKVDVEGHEKEVFRGATKLLRERRVRDIVFESTSLYPSAAHQALLDHGYTIFRMERSLFAPRLTNPETGGHEGELTDFVATVDLERLKARFVLPGWKALRL